MKITFFIAVLLLLSPLALAVTISTSIPGVTATSSPSEFVAGFYRFSLMIGGVLAFAAIVFGGVKYTFAAGNPSGQSEGKEWVKGALYGLGLLVGAYLILNVLNPDIVSLKIPALGLP
jgi:hypothetical protein